MGTILMNTFNAAKKQEILDRINDPVRRKSSAQKGGDHELIANYDLKKYETELGIPVWVGRLYEKLAAGLSPIKKSTWSADFIGSINPEVDLSPIKDSFRLKILQRNKGILDNVSLIGASKSTLNQELLDAKADTDNWITNFNDTPGADARKAATLALMRQVFNRIILIKDAVIKKEARLITNVLYSNQQVLGDHESAQRNGIWINEDSNAHNDKTANDLITLLSGVI